jgi:hypothetical protein
MKLEDGGMAVSTCIKCSAHAFELALFTPIAKLRGLMHELRDRVGKSS